MFQVHKERSSRDKSVWEQYVRQWQEQADLEWSWERMKGEFHLGRISKVLLITNLIQMATFWDIVLGAGTVLFIPLFT